MRLLNLTHPTPELNLAFDEALLMDPAVGETLRLWEADKPFVVLGRSSGYDDEVDVPNCEASSIPILRRVSGGATIVTGPGCLMYAVTLDLEQYPELADLGKAHAFVLERMSGALRKIDPSVSVSGTSDLTLSRAGITHKFSGNSLRRVRDRLLYHGTLLYDFDLFSIARLLRTAPRQPEYREQRDHEEFVTNLAADRAELTLAIERSWEGQPGKEAASTLALADRLVAEKYALDSWNRSR